MGKGPGIVLLGPADRQTDCAVVPRTHVVGTVLWHGINREPLPFGAAALLPTERNFSGSVLDHGLERGL